MYTLAGNAFTNYFSQYGRDAKAVVELATGGDAFGAAWRDASAANAAKTSGLIYINLFTRLKK